MWGVVCPLCKNLGWLKGFSELLQQDPDTLRSLCKEVQLWTFWGTCCFWLEHVVVFVVWLWLGLNLHFLNFFFLFYKDLFLTGHRSVTTFMIHMTYVYSFSLMFSFLSHNHWIQRSPHHIMIFLDKGHLDTWCDHPTFSSSTSTAPPYSPSISLKDGPIWINAWPPWCQNRGAGSSWYGGREPWFAQIRHWYGLIGPSISRIRMPLATTELGTLTGFTGGEGAWKPIKTSWVHCRLWLKVPTTYPPITDWVHSKCSQIMCSTWNLWEHYATFGM